MLLHIGKALPLCILFVVAALPQSQSALHPRPWSWRGLLRGLPCSLWLCSRDAAGSRFEHQRQSVKLPQCLPAATLLQSSNQAYQHGVSGPFWYAAGATIQIILFGILAVQIKMKAPSAHTVLEIVHARWGNAGHLVFFFFCFLTNIIVSAMLILGGAAVMTALTGMNTVAVSAVALGQAHPLQFANVSPKVPMFFMTALTSRPVLLSWRLAECSEGHCFPQPAAA